MTTATGDLGSMLVAAGKISEDQLAKARELTKKGEKLTQALVQVGAIASEDEVSVFVGRQLNIGAMRLSDVELNPEVVKLIPLDIARKFNGEWILAGGPLAFNLDGWVAQAGSRSYQGTMTRFGHTVTACECANLNSHLTRPDEP